MPSPAELRRAERAYQRAVRRADEERERRDNVMRAARADGWTLADLARETGLSHQRVAQVVKGRR